MSDRHSHTIIQLSDDQYGCGEIVPDHDESLLIDTPTKVLGYLVAFSGTPNQVPLSSTNGVGGGWGSNEQPEIRETINPHSMNGYYSS